MVPCIALSKGRLEKAAIDFFEAEPLVDKGRKLCIETNRYRFIFAKGIDVATYVEYGIADLGIVGEDILLEYQPDVFDLFPLSFGQCRFSLAGKPGHIVTGPKKRIATKYPNITLNYFRKRGESVDIVKLEGSVELAPVLGLADAIVDIVETGSTLKENGLVVYDDIRPISARLIANRSALKVKREVLKPLLERFQEKEVGA
ncbi:ATP phosphoribosyltransferase [Tuberibacillus calidus]|jgi:ATP phosphoribosyltransferase|uniref:ATP phosphoribosyltransferase n=1 Tax=Tuberibacillus calidus TaxID=340097 RepID=UPI00040B1F93|nr:ATP phosphoribosyltransferase [Tuberibacillus calidus]